MLYQASTTGLHLLKLSSIVLPMSQDRLIPLRDKVSGDVYWTSKNKKKVERKIELKKYSKKLRKRVIFKEEKYPLKALKKK